MTKPKTIEHSGVISKITEQTVEVTILTRSACASCFAKTSCNISEEKEKIINVPRRIDEEYALGEDVNVFYKQSLGFKAVTLAYIIPFLLVITALIITQTISENEVIAGTASLSILVPYYIILYFSRNKLIHTFAFSIKKI